MQFVDYDGVRFHLSTPESKTVLLLSMNIRCWDELVRYGAVDVLKREYGSLLSAQVEPDYNVSLEVDLVQAPPEGGMYVTYLHIPQSDQHLFTRGPRYVRHVPRTAQA